MSTEPPDPPSLREGVGGWAPDPPGVPEVPQPAAGPPPNTHASRRAPDPWAHRRAEPRTFAFIWTMYLFLATISTYAIIVTSGAGGHDIVRPAAQMLLALAAAGVVVVWPLVRLSQAPDQRSIAAPFLDCIVVLVPIQAIIWPQCAWWLAGWPVEVVAAVAAMVGGWAALMGGLIAITHVQRPRSSISPALWMAMVLGMLVIAHAPVVATAGAPTAGADTATRLVRAPWMLSPITAVYELTQDRTWIGTTAAVSGGHWRLTGLTWGVAMALWLVAIGMAARARRAAVRGLH